VERGELNDEKTYGCIIIVKPVELDLRAEGSTIDGIEEINENIRLRVWNDTAGHKE
jgi:hypothetical protein